MAIKCSNCGKPIPWPKFKPHFKDSGVIVLRDRALCCYQVECVCGRKGDYNKDYVREEWQRDNPGKKTIRKLG